jgi:uncharacterized protein involved in exopolysaccharide biosynthesis
VASTITLAEFIESALRRWGLVVIVTMAGAAIAAVMAVTQDRIYQGQAIVIPVESDALGSEVGALSAQFGGLASLVGIDLGKGSNRREAIELLRSRGFIARFITDEQLLPVLFAEKWDRSKGRWKAARRSSVPTLNDGVRYFEKKIRGVTEDNRTGVVRVTILWKNPEDAARWANVLVERVNAELSSRSIAESERMLAYLGNELKKTQVVEVQQAIYRLMENQIKSITFANAREDFALRVIDSARPADQDDFVKPRRLLLVVLGALAGLGAALAFIVFWTVTSRARRSEGISISRGA